MFRPAAIDGARRAERAQLIVQLVVGRGDSILGLAKFAHREILRYATGPWRFDRDRLAPHDERHQLHHAIMLSCGGKVLSVSRLREILRLAKLPAGGPCNRQSRPGNCAA